MFGASTFLFRPQRHSLSKTLASSRSKLFKFITLEPSERSEVTKRVIVFERMHIKPIIVGASLLMHVAFSMDCLGVVDEVGTPVSINSCVSNINYETNETISFKYECNADTAGLNQLFYDNAGCSGTPTQNNDATEDVIEYNCDTDIICDSFTVSIISGVECGINGTNGTNHTGDEVVSMSIVADQCVNVTSLDLPSGAISADFLCNTTHYQVQHYSGIYSLSILLFHF